MIVLGCDVGANTGLALLDCSGARPRFVSCSVERADLMSAVSALCTMHPIAAVGIETPTQVFEHGRAREDEGARRSIERALLVARDAAGVVRATVGLVGRGAAVHDGQAHHVRRAVLGKLPREGLDRFIAERVRLLIEGWPERSNTHQRDAAIVALWAWQRERAGMKPGERQHRADSARQLSAGAASDAEFSRRLREHGRGRSQVYHAEQGQQAASSAGRKAAEAAFAKLTGADVDAVAGELKSCGVKVTRRGDVLAPLHNTREAAQAECDRANEPIVVTIDRDGAERIRTWAKDELRKRKAEKVALAGSEDASPRFVAECKTHGAALGEWCDGAKKTCCAARKRLAGLASAAERVVPVKPTGERRLAGTPRLPPPEQHEPSCCIHEAVKKGNPPRCNCVAGVPDQAAMRDIARSVPCALVEGCDADKGMGCATVPNEPLEYGVHLLRARAAGLPPFPCVADLDAGAKPARVAEFAFVGGTEQPRWTWLPGRGAEVWLVLPWNVKECDAGCENGVLQVYDPVTEIGPKPQTCGRCGGRGGKPLYTRALGHGDPPPERLTFAVPEQHRAEHGRTVTLTRTTITTRAGRLAWLFTMKEGQGS